MSREIDQTEFKQIQKKLEENIKNNLSVEVETKFDNPYIILESTTKLSGTREEVLSSIGTDLLDTVKTDYTLSFTDVGKAKGVYTYTIKIKELKSSVF